MLKKQHRLRSDFECKVARKYGKKYSYKLFNCVVCRPLNYQGPTKIGLIIPLSYHKNAVKRNKIKRLFREALIHKISQIPDNFWIIFYPKQTCLYNENYEEISSQIDQALSEIPFLG